MLGAGSEPGVWSVPGQGTAGGGLIPVWGGQAAAGPWFSSWVFLFFLSPLKSIKISPIMPIGLYADALGSASKAEAEMAGQAEVAKDVMTVSAASVGSGALCTHPHLRRQSGRRPWAW